MNNRVSTTAEHLISQLSSRERDVARLLAWGRVQKEIADALRINPLTVSVHLRNIYRKIRIHKETDLTRCWIFFENGIADNPLKQVFAVLCLCLSCMLIAKENEMVRVFREGNLKPVTRVMRQVKVRRYRSVFDLVPEPCMA